MGKTGLKFFAKTASDTAPPSVSKSSNSDCPEVSCDPCKETGDCIEAEGFCSDCNEYLCKDCFSIHRKPKPSRHHVLLDKLRMPLHKTTQEDPDECTDHCQQHAHYILDWFCNNHQQFACSKCVATQHKSCQNVCIPVEAEHLKESQDYKDTSEKLTQLTMAAEDFIQKTHQNFEAVDHCKQKITESFEQFREDLNQALCQLENIMTDLLENHKNEDKQKMSIARQKYGMLLEKVQAYKSKFQTLENSGQFCQLFAAMKKAKNDLQSLQKALANEDATVRTCSLFPSIIAEGIIQDPSTIGHFVESTYPSIQSGQDGTTTNDEQLLYSRRTTTNDEQLQDSRGTKSNYELYSGDQSRYETTVCASAFRNNEFFDHTASFK